MLTLGLPFMRVQDIFILSRAPGSIGCQCNPRSGGHAAKACGRWPSGAECQPSRVLMTFSPKFLFIWVKDTVVWRLRDSSGDPLSMILAYSSENWQGNILYLVTSFMPICPI